MLEILKKGYEVEIWWSQVKHVNHRIPESQNPDEHEMISFIGMIAFRQVAG